MAILFIALATLVFVACLLLRSDRCLYLLALTIPLDRVLTFPTPVGFISIFDMMLFGTAVVVATRTLSAGINRFKISDTAVWYGFFAVLFIISGVVSFGVALVPETALRALISRIQGVILFFLCLIILTNKRRIQTLLLVMFAGATGAAVTVLLQGFGVIVFDPGTVSEQGRTVAGVTLPFARSSGIFSVYGRYGAYLYLPFAATIVSLIKPGVLGLRRSVTAPTAAVLGFSILVTQSRSTWLSALVLGAVLITFGFGILYRDQLAKRAFIITAFITIGAVFIIRFAPLLISVKPATFISRLEQIKIAASIIIENPITGIGKGGFVAYYLEAYGTRTVLHNIYANVFVQSGLLGLIPFVTLHLLPIVQMFRLLSAGVLTAINSLLGVALLAGCVGILIELQFSSGLAFGSFWLAIGTTAAAFFVFTDRRPFDPFISSRTSSESTSRGKSKHPH